MTTLTLTGGDVWQLIDTSRTNVERLLELGERDLAITAASRHVRLAAQAPYPALAEELDAHLFSKLRSRWGVSFHPTTGEVAQ